ncbi:MAG: hypothetical protein LUC37_00960 [Prevotella sp.]|nr:hypothetical protein [Prevotella sp.]
MFYSINEIGDDEVVYTPVLFLDTLKVSTLEKSADDAFAQGGLGNKRLIKWNFNKQISLTLEDALFSPASMSMLWGGKLNMKLSPAISIISKVNMANLYGRLRYSTKAYPSPALTLSEWEIVFKILQNSGIDGTVTQLDVLDEDVPSTLPPEWRQAFIDRYYDRPALFDGIKEVEPDDGSARLDKQWTYLFDKYFFGTDFGVNYLKISQLNIEGYEGIDDNYDDDGNLKPTRYRWYEAKAMPEYVIFIIRNAINRLEDLGEIDTSQGDVEVIDRWERCLVTTSKGFEFSQEKQLDNLFRYYADDRSSSYTIYYDSKNMLPLTRPEDGNISWEKKELSLTSLSEYHSFIKSCEEYSTEVNYTIVITQEGLEAYKREYPYLYKWLKLHKFPLAQESEQESVSVVVTEIPEIVRIEFLCYMLRENLTDCYEWGLYDSISQVEFISSGVSGELSLKFFITKASASKVITTFSSSAEYYQYMLSLKEIVSQELDTVRLKLGTVYYKWTRTVKYAEYEYDSVLGQSFIINTDTFPDDYRIVGETYIRNQKTGKDERYQFTIFRANISSDTNLTLEAGGDPTTFSMTVDVLSPENDIMMQLTQMDVEEDRFEGGTRIVPMKGTYTYTHSMSAPEEVLAPIDNNEIY